MNVRIDITPVAAFPVMNKICEITTIPLPVECSVCSFHGAECLSMTKHGSEECKKLRTIDGPCAGYCLITASASEIGTPELPKTWREALIWHIHTDHGYRRKGFAKCMIAGLKDTFDVIHTQAMTSEGNNLLISCGFKIEGEETNLYYVWRKA